MSILPHSERMRRLRAEYPNGERSNSDLERMIDLEDAHEAAGRAETIEQLRDVVQEIIRLLPQ